MEDVLDEYEKAYDPAHPRVTLDETNRQLIGEVREAVPAKPGRARREDCEYVRNGTANIFLAFEPLAGRRFVEVTLTRKRVDFAHFVKGLLDGPYADAKRVTLVMDQLNTHNTASFYEAFEPAEARRLAERIEIHYTPKHGSWLNMAEIELSVLSRQCLARRIADRSTLEREIAAWTTARNAAASRVDWQFTTTDARIKLKRLYPTLHA